MTEGNDKLFEQIYLYFNEYIEIEELSKESENQT
jgi:hypothetical protein